MKCHLNLRQLAGWIAWLQKEPRGDRRADVRSAFQTAYVRQALHGVEESVETFLPRFRDVVVISDPEVDRLLNEFLQPMPLIGF